jgi:hypothetical protein
LPGHIRRVGLVIVIDELHGPTEQAALGVDFFLPDPGAEQRLLAGPGERAGLRHAEADLNRFAATLRVSRRPRERRREQSRADAGIDMAPRDAMGHGFPPQNGIFSVRCAPDGHPRRARAGSVEL